MKMRKNRHWGFVSGKDELFELGCLLDLESELGFAGEPEDVKFVLRRFRERRIARLQALWRRERGMFEVVMSGGLGASPELMRRETPDCGNGYDLESGLGVSSLRLGAHE
jgi:hypothetical protein